MRKGSEVTPVEMLPGVVRLTRIHSEKLMLVEFRLAAGTVVPMHRHPQEQCGVVLNGRMTLTVAGQETVLGAGDAYCIPGGVEHGVAVHEDAVAVDAFTPPREDYI